MPEKRVRRSDDDQIQIMREQRGRFASWAYAGEKGTVRKVFDGYFSELRDDRLLKEINDPTSTYFSRIPDQVLRSPVVIERYGKILRSLRESHGWSLEAVASNIGEKFQALQKIETGDRKFIRRNTLLLLCGVYQVSPEFLLGIPENLSEQNKVQSVKNQIKSEEIVGLKGDAELIEEGQKESQEVRDSSISKTEVEGILFLSENAGEQTNYIIKRLIYEKECLLEAFSYLATRPVSEQKKLISFLSSIPAIKMLSPQKIKKVLQQYDNDEFCQNLVQNPNRKDTRFVEYYANLCDVDRANPDLLDVYISVAAADRKAWDLVYELIAQAGYLDNMPDSP